MDVLGMSIGQISAIISGLLGTSTIFFGAKYSKGKKLLRTLSKAIEDDSINKDELRKIIKQFKDLID